MTEVRKEYEQFCTHIGENAVFEEICNSNGERKVVCTCKECMFKDEKCRNKLRQNC